MDEWSSTLMLAGCRLDASPVRGDDQQAACRSRNGAPAFAASLSALLTRTKYARCCVFCTPVLLCRLYVTQTVQYTLSKRTFRNPDAVQHPFSHPAPAPPAPPTAAAAPAPAAPAAPAPAVAAAAPAPPAELRATLRTPHGAHHAASWLWRTQCCSITPLGRHCGRRVG